MKVLDIARRSLPTKEYILHLGLDLDVWACKGKKIQFFAVQDATQINHISWLNLIMGEMSCIL